VGGSKTRPGSLCSCGTCAKRFGWGVQIQNHVLTVPAKKRLGGGGGDADPGPGSGPPPVVPALSKHKGFVLLSPTV
jgi:hypothetical protein